MSSERIVIFSKSADAGKVKTRMFPVLNVERCLDLHLALLQDTLTKVRQFSAVLYLAGSGHLPFVPDVQLWNQHGHDLGERMMNAFQKELGNFSRVIIIGIDSPTFPVDTITRAFTALESRDVVLGPSEDGGYYLIGLRKMIPELFFEIPWGTENVLPRTLEKLQHVSHVLLESCFDVDYPADLLRLKNELKVNIAPHTQHLRKWFED